MTDADRRRSTIAVISLCSTERVHHLRNQLAALVNRPDVSTVVVWVGDDDPPVLNADRVLSVPSGTRRYPSGRGAQRRRLRRHRRRR